MTDRSHPPSPTGQGLSRRELLCGGLSLAGLLQAALARASRPHGRRAPRRIRSCILIFYYGGPCQLDTWDMKPAAPSEVRGPFRPIATTVPGVRVCEHLPHTARVMHQLAVVRSMHHPMRNHNSAAVEALCGRTPLKGDLELLADDPNSFPSYGSVLSVLRPGRRDLPGHVALPHLMYNVVVLPGQTAGFLGAAANPFQLTCDPTRTDLDVGELQLPSDLSATRLQQRQSLLSVIDGQTPCRPAVPAGERMSVYQERAFELLRSRRLREALRLSRETAAVRDRYGRNRFGQSLLLARRLVEAGVRFINVNDKVHNGQLENWDSHEKNFPRLKDDLLPPADLGFSALIEDLDARGLLASTLVVALGEFGRTPRINPAGGRDHWPDCFSVVLAGGGVRGGMVYGASDRIGAFPASDPVTPGDLAATIFWCFGLDPAMEIHDLTGRPYRIADGEPLHRLFG